MVNPRKVYAIDTGLVQAMSLSFTRDRGHRLENAVYLHLRQTGHDLFYFREEKECDFVVFENRACKMVLQVCERVTDDNLQRETAGRTEAMTFFGLAEGYIITRNQQDELRMESRTIHLVPAFRFVEGISGDMEAHPPCPCNTPYSGWLELAAVFPGAPLICLV